jgi:hypothetical protein
LVHHVVAIEGEAPGLKPARPDVVDLRLHRDGRLPHGKANPGRLVRCWYMSFLC